MSTPLLDAALRYAARGWPVFPVGANKKPCIAGGNGCNDATTDEEKLRAWWRAQPQAQIGLAMGHGRIAVDEDTYKAEGGVTALASWGLTSTLTVRTARGGRHYHYAFDGDLPCVSEDTPWAHVCVKATGGYVVAPPSRVKGGVYTWETDPATTPIAPLPAPVVARILGASRLHHALQQLRDGNGDHQGYLLAQQLVIAERADARCVPAETLREYARLATRDASNPFDERSVQRWEDSARKSKLGQTGKPVRNGLGLKSAEGAAAPWETPLPLAGRLPPVAALDMDMLPAALRGFVWDIAERQQAPVDYPAVAVLVAAGAVVGRRIGIHPKRFDDWEVVPNLWGGAIGPSGWLKSPTLTAALKPLERLIAAAHEAREQAHRFYEADKLAYEARKGALVAQMKKAMGEWNVAAATVLKGDIANLLPPTERKPRRYRTNDATVEKLGELLMENPAGILAHRDELTGWLRAMDKQGHEGDRAFYLEAWGGTSRNYEIDRIGRGSLVVPALCVSVFGGIQPGPLRKYVYAAADSGNAGADGLLQRFQLLVWPDAPTGYKRIDRWPNAEAKAAAFAVFQRLAVLQPDAYGAVADDLTDPAAIPCLRFSADAQAVFDDWLEALERRIRSGDLADALTAHLSKYRSLMPALALGFHLIDADPTKAGYEAAVGLTAALRATTWCEYLEPHAARVYASATHPGMERAAALLKHLQRGEVTEHCTPRDIYVHGWEHLQTAEDVEDALHTLEAYGWVRIEHLDAGPHGGRPTKTLHLHPSLLRRASTAGDEDGDD